MDAGQLAGLDAIADEVAGLLLQCQIDRRRGAILAAQHFAQIEGSTQLAARLADQDQGFALGHAAKAGHDVIVGQQADRADGRGRRNGDAVGLVVEADIARHDGEVERAARLGHAVDGPHDLAHDFGPLRIAEVEVVGDGDGARAHGGQVAPGLGHALLSALIGIVLDIAGGAVAGHRQPLVRAVHADHAGVGAGGRVVQGVGHDVTVVLLPQPALGGHVGAADHVQYGVGPAIGGGHILGVDARMQFGLDPGPVIERGVVEQGRQRHVADDLALMVQDQTAGVGGTADDGGIQAPLLEDAIAVFLAAGLEHGQHALLAFGEHHLIGGHALFALGHGVHVQLDTDAALAGHLDRRGGQAGGAHVLDGGHGARGH